MGQSDRQHEPGEERQTRRLAAIVMNTFAPPSLQKGPAARTYWHVAETAIDWQKVGVHAAWVEVHARNLGLELDRLHELCGCVAAAGEQLGLAWTSQQEHDRWMCAGEELDSWGSAVRALADIRAHFALAAAHGLGNAQLRTLFLSPTAASVLVAKPYQIGQLPPFSDDRGAWRTFNERLLGALEAGAAATGKSEVVGQVAILRQLLDGERFSALEERRGMDFHRWRPQSLPLGSSVPRESLWERSPGTVSINFGGTFPGDDTGGAAAVANIATDGMQAIAEAMAGWLRQWPAAMNALDVPIWKIDDNED